MKLFKKIYKDYYQQYKGNGDTQTQEPVHKKQKTDHSESSIDFNVLFLKADDSLELEKELNNYLTSCRTDPDCDILMWWKKHYKVYPIISKMAWDI